MSEAVSVLNGAQFDGAVKVAEAGLHGMITLRGDLASEKIALAVKSATGLSMPAQRQIRSGKKASVAWMSPDELLLLVDYEQAGESVRKIEKSLVGVHHLVADVSDARSLFVLKGEGVREVIAKGAPADLSLSGLPVGEIRRTRLGQLAVAFWMTEDTELRLVCFRSVGAHVYTWLCNAAAKGSLPGVL